MYDLIIIGAGPAGITASIYAARKRLNFLVVTKDIGGQAAWSGDIENYTGYQFVTGPELTKKFEEHMHKYNITVKEGEEVLEIKKRGDNVLVKTNKGEYEVKAAIIASGKVSKELGVRGEKEFKNKGVSYCATCDGPVFSGKDVAIIGGGNSALDAAMQMTKIARHVHIINNTSALGGDAIMRQKVEKSGNVTVMNGSRVVEISGDRMVNGIKIEKNGKIEDIKVQGIFIEVGLVPNSVFAKEIEQNEWCEIKVNDKNETNVAGIFAAGDVTNVTEKQIIIAAGEGSKAALSVFKYLYNKR